MQRSHQRRLPVMGRMARIGGSDGLVKPSQSPANGFTGFYCRRNGQLVKADPNARRLACFPKMSSLSPSAVAKAASVSPAYRSRVLSETEPFVGSAGFYRWLEACLGQLVEQRQQQFFWIATMNVRSVEKAAREVLEEAEERAA